VSVAFQLQLSGSRFSLAPSQTTEISQISDSSGRGSSLEKKSQECRLVS